MAKKYVFNEIEYDSLNELGNAFSLDFESAMENIFANPKALIKFVRSKNKKLAKEIASNITTSKYQNNATTFIIFNLCDDKKVVINGEVITFKALVNNIKKFGSEHKAIYAFMEDLGITKTFAKLNIEPKLANDSYFIEKNINDPFVYEYISTFYEFDYVESLHGFISNVFIYDDERFRRASKIIRTNQRFNLIMAHRLGFKNIYLMRQEKMPLFSAIKYLKSEFNEDDLAKLISNTFFWWLLDNFDKYQYKKEAKDIYKSLKKTKNNKKKLDKNYTLDAFVDLSSELYELYLRFVDKLKEGLITVKKKFNEAEYTLDKLYCNTYICSNYMKDNPVKLSTENIMEEKPEPQYDENGEEIVVVRDENPDLLEDDDDMVQTMSNEIPKKILKKRVKQMAKMKRFITQYIMISLVSLIFGIVGFIVAPIIELDGKSLKEYEILSMPLFIVFILLMIAGLVISIVLGLKVKKTGKSIDDIIMLSNFNASDANMTPKQEKMIQALKENEEKIRQRALNEHRILSAILCAFLSFGVCVFGIYLISIIDLLIELPIGWKESYLQSSSKIVYLLAAPVFGVAYGILRKRKGALTAILLALVAMLSIIIFSFVL